MLMFNTYSYIKDALLLFIGFEGSELGHVQERSGRMSHGSAL